MGKGASSEGQSEGIRARQEVLRIVLKLIDNYWLYFDKYETLNSDGVRLLATALRYSRLLDRPTRLRLREALRERTSKSIETLAEALGVVDAERLLREVKQGLDGVKIRY